MSLMPQFLKAAIRDRRIAALNEAVSANAPDEKIDAAYGVLLKKHTLDPVARAACERAIDKVADRDLKQAFWMAERAAYRFNWFFAGTQEAEAPMQKLKDVIGRIAGQGQEDEAIQWARYVALKAATQKKYVATKLPREARGFTMINACPGNPMAEAGVTVWKDLVGKKSQTDFNAASELARDAYNKDAPLRQAAGDLLDDFTARREPRLF